MDAMENSIETFWAQELSSKRKVFEWDGEDDRSEGLESTVELRGACLGVSAKANERNIVALTTEDSEGEEMKHVIVSLRLEKNEQVPLFISLQPPVKLELVQGSGPVHITGQMTTVLVSDDDDEYEEEEEQEQEVIKPDFLTKEAPTKINLKKGLVTSTLPKTNKTTKKEPENEEEDESEDNDNETSMDITSSPEKSLKRKAPDNEDNDGEDDENEEEEDSEEDDDSEEEEEESEEEQQPPPKKTKGVSGKAATPSTKKTGKNQSRTPQPTKPLKPAIKTPQSMQVKGSKDDKKTTPKGVMSLDEIKKKLIQSPNIPKKLDKFNNYVSNTYKVADNSIKKQLWEFVQKNRK